MKRSVFFQKWSERLILLAVALGLLFCLAGCDTPQPSTPSQGSGGNEDPEDPYACSDILKNVLTDLHYTQLIQKNDSSKVYGSYPLSHNNNTYESIPYGFLEDEGFDVEKIKSNKLVCETNVYRINNDLFIDMRVETEAEENYLTNYVIKYSLSSQELEDLNEIFISLAYGYKCTSYQAPFFIQELSYHKDAEIVSKMKTTMRANQELCKNVERLFHDNVNGPTLVNAEFKLAGVTRYYWRARINTPSSSIQYNDTLYIIQSPFSDATHDENISAETIYDYNCVNIISQVAYDKRLTDTTQIISYNCNYSAFSSLDSQYIQEHFKK